MLKHFLELVLMNNNEEVLRRNLEKKIGGFIFLLEGGGGADHRSLPTRLYHHDCSQFNLIFEKNENKSKE